MKHILKSKCVKRARWINGELICPCGSRLAVRYNIFGQIRIFTYRSFEKYKYEIEDREDSFENTGESNFVGYLGNEEWDDILNNI